MCMCTLKNYVLCHIAKKSDTKSLTKTIDHINFFVNGSRVTCPAVAANSRQVATADSSTSGRSHGTSAPIAGAPSSTSTTTGTSRPGTNVIKTLSSQNKLECLLGTTTQCRV
jgi:hypothetical protein